MAKWEVTTEEVASIGTAPAAPSAVFKENAEVVVAQASATSATDTSESAPQFLDPGAESSAEPTATAEPTAAAESTVVTETVETTETTEAAFGTPTEGATGAIEGEGLLKEGEEGLLDGALAASGGSGVGSLGATGLGGATTDPFAAAMGAATMGAAGAAELATVSASRTQTAVTAARTGVSRS